MSDDFVQLQPNSTGNKVDCSVVTVGANAVDRQRIGISDPTDANGHAGVITTTPTAGQYGLVVRPIGTVISGTATVTFGTAVVTFGTSTVTFGSAVIGSGTITANLGNAIPAGTAQVGSVTAIISGTPTVTFGSAVIASGTITANIGNTPTVTFNSPSVTFGTAVVQGSTGNLTAAAGNPLQIGLLDSISRIRYMQGDDNGSPIVVITAGTKQIGSVTASISGTPTVTFGTITTTLGAGANQIGSVTATISGTATVTFGAITNTLGASSAQIGSVTATISGVPTVTFGSITTVLGAGANQIGSVTAIISGTPTVTFGQAIIASGTITANIGNTPTVTFGTATVTMGSVVIGSGTVTATISGTPTVTFGSINADVSSTGNITAVDAASTTVTSGQNSSTIITGSATANSFVTTALTNRSQVDIQLAGTWVGTLSFERSIDGGTTWNLNSAHIAGTGVTTAAPTANGSFHASIAGCTNFRVRCTAYTSGTVNVTLTQSSSVGDVYLINPLKLVGADGVSMGTIKAANTASVTGDTPLVVALHPSSATPTGTNTIGTVTANIGNTPTVTFGQAIINSGTITANIGNAIPAGTNQVGSVTATISGTPTVTFGIAAITINAGSNTIGTVTAVDVPNSVTGWTPFFNGAVTGATVTVTGISGNLGGYMITNINTSVAYVQIFDAAVVTAGTTAPKLSLGIPGSSAANLDSDKGIYFTNSIKVIATTAVTGGTGVTTGVIFNAWYKTA